MDKDIVVKLHSSFEDMVQKHPETGTEFWCARKCLTQSEKELSGSIFDRLRDNESFARIGFGTTDFHVIRPGPDITPQWTHSFFRQPSFLQKAIEHFTGAVGQQRLPPDYLKALEIPLPPLPEQKRIAAILNEQMAAVEL
jgi:hypothetical protein